MANSLIQLIRGQEDTLPNKFSESLGELIRCARVESGLSQSELADKAYLNQAAISQIEKGKRSVSAEEIVYLSMALNKPILYFYNMAFIPHFEINDLTIHEQELLIQTKKLSPEDLSKVIAQVKALADLTN